MSRADRPIPFSPPSIGEEEIREVVDTLRSQWITTGPKTRDFEERFAAAMGAPAALALNSCTAGLHTALLASGVGPGAEVVTTPMTFAASVNVIEHVGARPVLADVEPDTLNLDPERAAAAVGPATRALLPVHYGGHPVDLDAFDALAAAHGLVLIEDAAHALPSRHRGRQIGSGGRIASFSFYATKNLTTAEGGMLVGPPDLLARARVLSLHGVSRDAFRRSGPGSWRYEVVVPGFKFNMTDIQASLGLCQLRKLEAFQARRREIVGRYDAAFAGSAFVETLAVRPEVEPSRHLYVLRLRLEALTIDRDVFLERLGERGIGTSVHFIPIHLHSYYRDRYGWRPEDFPVALAAYHRIFSLPLHPGLADADVDDVIEAVREVAAAHRR